MSTSADGSVALTLERDRCVPGDSLGGRVLPVPLVLAVDLVRVESSPAATLEFTVASAAPRSDGSFALQVPADAPPSVDGKRCALVWRVRARTSAYPQHSDSRRTLEIACPS